MDIIWDEEVNNVISDFFFLTAGYYPTLPVIVTVMPGDRIGTPVAGQSYTLTCDHASTAVNPTYQWFDDTGTMVGTQATYTLNPLMESHSGEYSCLVTDLSDGMVGCGVYRVTVQGMDITTYARMLITFVFLYL